jgi:hypothetical protein
MGVDKRKYRISKTPGFDSQLTNDEGRSTICNLQGSQLVDDPGFRRVENRLMESKAPYAMAFHRNGIIIPDSINLAERKLISQTCQQFLGFMADCHQGRKAGL